MKNKAVLIGGIIGLIIGVFFLILMFMNNDFSSQPILNFLSYVPIPFLFLIILGLSIGYSIEKKLYKPLVFFLVLFFITAGINLSSPLKEYNSPHSVFKEKVVIRFDSVEPEKRYVNYDNPELDNTAVWYSTYYATVIEDGYADGVGDTIYLLSQGTSLTIEKRDGDLQKIYENYLRNGISSKLARNYVDQKHGSSQPPELGKDYEVILFSNDGKRFSFQHYVNPNGLTPSQEYNRYAAAKNAFFSLVVFSTPASIFFVTPISLFFFVLVTYGVGLIAILLGPLIAYLGTKNFGGKLKMIFFILIMLQFWVLLGSIIGISGILPEF